MDGLASAKYKGSLIQRFASRFARTAAELQVTHMHANIIDHNLHSSAVKMCKLWSPTLSIVPLLHHV